MSYVTFECNAPLKMSHWNVFNNLNFQTTTSVCSQRQNYCKSAHSQATFNVTQALRISLLCTDTLI